MKKRGLKVIETLQPGGRVFAVVRVVEHQTDRAILKDFSRSPWLFQQSFGRFLVALEACAYRRLEGVAGVPRLIARLTPHALLLEHVAGTNCLTAGPDRFSQEFFDHAAALLSEVRRRGVLHCDVGRNLVLGDDGKPWLVDFASSVVLPRRQGRVGAFLRQLRGKYDERALLKVKRRRAPHLLRATEAEQSRSVLPFEGWIRLGERFVRRTIGWLSG